MADSNKNDTANPELIFRLDRMSDFMIDMKDDISDIKVTMAKNTESLDHHIRRTGIAEERLDSYYKEKEYLEKKVDSHINMVKGAFWITGILATILFALLERGYIKF